MKKIKKFYQNNRIFCILMGISALCLAGILSFFVLYFVNQTKNDSYGNRLNGIETVKITKASIDEISSKMKEEKQVDNVIINVKGKILYITTTLKEGKYEEAQAIAIKSLNYINEEAKDFYDINFIFDLIDNKESIFPIMGYKKSDASTISWTKANGE